MVKWLGKSSGTASVSILIGLLLSTFLLVRAASSEPPSLDSSVEQLATSPILSLIVSTDNPNRMQMALEKLAELSARPKLRAGAIYVVGKEAIPQLSQSLASSNRQVGTAGEKSLHSLASRAGLPNYELRLQRSMFKDTKLTYSPTWVVRYRGKDYIYEGRLDPENLFTADGTFRGAGG